MIAILLIKLIYYLFYPAILKEIINIILNSKVKNNKYKYFINLVFVIIITLHILFNALY